MKRNLINVILVFFLAVFVVSCSKDSDSGGTPTPEPEPPVSTTLKFPRKEMRAAWIATVWGLDWPKSTVETVQKKEYTDLLDRLKELKFNSIFFQIKGLGDAYYESPYEPWSAYITGTRGKAPSYDVLKFLIDEAHARGIEFHAWMNPYRISTAQPYPALHSSIDPSWVIDYPSIRIYNPALPEVRQRLNDIVKDVITKYDVDGIHFDDYFYPSGVTHNDAADFAKYGAGYANIASFRRGNVDKAIEGVYNTIKDTKPQVIFSVSPAPNKDNNYNSLFADIAKWTSSGWVDILIPQLYQEIGNSYNPFEGNLSVWTQFRGKAKLVIGHGYYKFGATDGGTAFQNTQQLVNQFDLVRKNQYTEGSAMYSARDILANRIGISNVLANLYSKNVLMPFAGREVAAKPVTPTKVKISGNEISWSGSGSNIRYAVYYFSSLTAEGELVAVTTDSKANISKTGYYCVTAVNVDHVESKESTVVQK